MQLGLSCALWVVFSPNHRGLAEREQALARGPAIETAPCLATCPECLEAMCGGICGHKTPHACELCGFQENARERWLTLGLRSADGGVAGVKGVKGDKGVKGPARRQRGKSDRRKVKGVQGVGVRYIWV